MSKHTPGPWKVADRAYDRSSSILRPSFYILVGMDCEDSPTVCSLPCGPSVSDESWANARLIAAAPELLDALKQAVSSCPCTIAERESGHLTDCQAPFWSAVIFKAENGND